MASCGSLAASERARGVPLPPGRAKANQIVNDGGRRTGGDSPRPEDHAMPSPFPGMNPYLEQEVIWHDFHERFLPAAATSLVPQIRPKYIVLIDENIYLHDIPPSERRPPGRPDLSAARGEGAAIAGRAAAIGVLEAPAHVLLP